MRQPNILDFVRAVTALEPSHPGVKRWWYSPRTPFALEGGSDALGIGATAAFIPPSLDENELAAIFAEVQPKVVFTSGQHVD